MIKDGLSSIGGMAVVEASNGKEALEILAVLTPDIIITDLEMPAMNGFELINAIRKRSKTINSPVIVVSARILEGNGSVAGESDELKKLGVTTFFEKPVDGQALADAVRSMTALTPDQMTTG
jgi:CheY-like chemotaxis protein